MKLLCQSFSLISISSRMLGLLISRIISGMKMTARVWNGGEWEVEEDLGLLRDAICMWRLDQIRKKITALIRCLPYRNFWKHFIRVICSDIRWQLTILRLVMHPCCFQVCKLVFYHRFLSSFAWIFLKYKTCQGRIKFNKINMKCNKIKHDFSSLLLILGTIRGSIYIYDYMISNPPN
jgi:hypothetical protein